MADAAPMILRSLKAQQGVAPYVPEAHSRASDLEWSTERPLEPSDHGIEGVQDLPAQDTPGQPEGAD